MYVRKEPKQNITTTVPVRLKRQIDEAGIRWNMAATIGARLILQHGVEVKSLIRRQAELILELNNKYMRMKQRYEDLVMENSKNGTEKSIN